MKALTRLVAGENKHEEKAVVKPRFKKGDTVVFKSDSEAGGSIVEVDWQGSSVHDEPMYRVKIGTGSEWVSESELRKGRK